VKTQSFKVTLDIPTGASVRDAQEYILDAVQTWAGSLRPPGGHDDCDEGDPMFGLDRNKVKVVRYRKEHE